MLKFLSENYEGDERTYFHRNGDEMFSSYRLLLVAHNASGFDSGVVLKSLVEELTELNIIKSATGLIFYRFGVELK